MSGSIGPLIAADEGFNHQIVETFASVSQADLGWTEKVCGMAASRDGSLQIGFGFGKYTNRNVVDAYALVARGVEQWSVRASRALHLDPDSIDAGPIHYQIIEPLQQIRVWLDANEAQPISFDITFRGVVPCVMEEREDRRDRYGYRRATDQLRYHQTGVVSGWLAIDGERHAIDESSWVSTRDHSWGIRPSVGQPLRDMPPEEHAHLQSALAIWNPILFQNADGSQYAFHHYYLNMRGQGFSFERLQGGFEYTDGRLDKVVAERPQLGFDRHNKRLLAGEFVLTLTDGSERVLRFEPLGVGIHLGAGLYHGYQGHFHGEWRGEQHLEGDYYADTSTSESVEQLNQFRDCLLRVEDLHTGAIGWGNCQTYVVGPWAEFGLDGSEPRL